MKRTIQLLCVLFLLFPVSVLASEEVILGGDSIAISVEYEGVMITGTYDIHFDEETINPSKQGFQSGDLIIQANNQPITSISDLNAVIRSFRKPINQIPIIIMRNGKEKQLTLTSVYQKEMNAYQSGLYVKDEVNGIGTMTYYDPVHQTFGALGHAIDETGANVTGTISDANITGIIASKPNAVGEKKATVGKTETGKITLNDTIGLYGTYEVAGNGPLIETANQQMVKIGPAKLYTVLKGETVEAFDIEITQLQTQPKEAIKGISFTVTDERLLKETGGIVQGMSGSPIVQNGKLVGAVTHVVSSDPTKAYGVYYEFMKALSDEQH